MVEYVGEILTREQASEREGWYAEQLMPCSYSLFAEVFVIDPTLYGNAARFMNASCDPTVRPTEFKAARWAPGLANAPRVLFVATRDIAAGEELTWGYKAGAAQMAEFFPGLNVCWEQPGSNISPEARAIRRILFV